LKDAKLATNKNHFTGILLKALSTIILQIELIQIKHKYSIHLTINKTNVLYYNYAAQCGNNSTKQSLFEIFYSIEKQLFIGTFWA
jgi:hypothetical protein